MIAILWTCAALAQTPSPADGTSVAVHQALVAADQAWVAVPDGEPDAWTVFVVAMDDARVQVQLLNQVIQPDDAAAYLCLLDRKERAATATMPQDRSSCFDADELENWTVSAHQIECVGLYQPRWATGQNAGRRLAPTLQRRQWVVNGGGDCLKRNPDARGAVYPGVIQVTDSRGVVAFTRVGDHEPWEDARLTPRRPVVAAAMLGTAGVAAGLFGVASYQRLHFEQERSAFHAAPFDPDAGDAFGDSTASYKRSQSALLVSGGVAAGLSAALVLGFVVPW